MPQYIYILSTYNEYGAEDVHATLDRSRLIAMLEDGWLHHEPGYAKDFNQEAKRSLQQQREAWVRKNKDNLMDLLQKPDEELAISDCRGSGSQANDVGSGWGGMQLHVVRLYT